MCRVQNLSVTWVLLYFMLLCIVIVAGNNRTQNPQKSIISHPTISHGNTDTIKSRRKNRLLTVHSPWSGRNKTNINKEKALIKDTHYKGQKGTKVSKGPLHKTAIINKKMNATKDIKFIKSNLRMGNRDKGDKWPRVQKRRLKDKGILRSTKMNMMFMNDPSTFPTLTIHKLLGSDDNNTNEILSEYTIKEQMLRIGAKFSNANITMEVIGRTVEYNDIVLLKIAGIQKPEARFKADDTKYVDDANEKKIIFIVHGLSVMGMISLDCLVEERKFVRLLSYYLEFLDKFDIFLIPMANPDGYGERKEMWNKNQSPQDACPGVALDRNFDVAWNSSPTISSCSQQYPGPSPFSEPETRAIRDVMHRYSHKIVAYIHVHAGTYSSEVFKGDAVLYPRGYADIQSDDDKYVDIKGEIDEAMRKASFQIYSVTVDTLYNWYGKVTGASVDYASTVYGIPYAMEFVMQLYSEEGWEKKPSEEQTSYYVVVEVWKRVIDVVFNNIWNSLQSNEV